MLATPALAAPGDLDTSFGIGGKVTTPIGSNDDVGFSMAVQSDGKILVAGYSHNGSNYDFALVRYTSMGSLDSTFNGTGKVTTRIGSSYDYCYSVALQSDGRILVGGSSNGSNHDFALVRYLGDTPTGPPVILTQPQSQTLITAGQGITLSVSATGAPPLTYQWRLNGINVAGATSPTLTIPNTQLANAGNYTVTISNSAGQVTSTPAKLTVLSNLDVAAPGRTSYTFPQAPAGTDSLIFITHGRVDPNEPANSPGSAWIETMKSKIQNAVLPIPSNWAVLTYHWETDATTSKVQLADGVLLARAYKHGVRVGNELLLQGFSLPGGKWQHIHFIAHSAGSGLIETASRIVKQGVSQNAPTIQTTFLDPFTAMFDGNSNRSDNYYSLSPDTWDDRTFFGHRTYGPMAHCYNVDVTWLDPDYGRQIKIYTASQYSANSTPATLLPSSITLSSTHGWPINFYLNTIPPVAPDRPAAYGNYGFPLSKEGGVFANDNSQPRPSSPSPPGAPASTIQIS